MGASPEELAADVERTRDELGRTLDAIGEKVGDVKQRVEHVKEEARPANLIRTKAAKVAGGVLLGLFLLSRLGKRRKRRRAADD